MLYDACLSAGGHQDWVDFVAFVAINNSIYAVALCGEIFNRFPKDAISLFDLCLSSSPVVDIQLNSLEFVIRKQGSSDPDLLALPRQLRVSATQLYVGESHNCTVDGGGRCFAGRRWCADHCCTLRLLCDPRSGRIVCGLVLECCDIVSS